ncbi:adenylate/guanylate cyclase domain-containing protein [Mycobacterium asiaticum]|uniref:Cyclase n=1 Tax=Mycobacterium asiaticum TaxID=1790 RepID=A0A1A3CPK5_MYCAS|nr:adenylate/guanylate cyclase domain-containing protein [Mycobacterium asiaticum]OBI88292.1 cyclase [Mycobacterium asiaticum]
MKAIAACPTCATEILETARFCHGCGSPVRDADTRAEYKQVTVLFADVVHSMDIAAVVGAERLREIMADLVARCAAVVRRYGGTVDKFTGDGIMAVFGAPVALEDHAVRACLAALEVQGEAVELAPEIQHRDAVELRLRVGLNSGQVVAGEIGAGGLGYTAVGEQVGMAQRMESVAPPGGVMLSEATARLVEHAAALGEPQLVRIKGNDQPVAARRLLGLAERHQTAGPAKPNLVGRREEMSAGEELLERAASGTGTVAVLVGSAGIGKSRLMHEICAVAVARGVEVVGAFCESHTTQMPFHLVARLLRAEAHLSGLDAEADRARLRDRYADADADPEDLALLEDLLGIRDSSTPLPDIAPDARRRRLTALVNTASRARRNPAAWVIEDAHWIDEASESMLGDFLTVIPQTPTLVLITCRPEYRGELTHVTGAETISLAPLDDPESSMLLGELLGCDPTVAELAKTIGARAAGNPFFAEEMVRDLAERGVLCGSPGAYTCRADVGDVSVPATLQATIAARIDRLEPWAKRVLRAAAVIGSRFSADLLTSMDVDAVPRSLLDAELIERVESGTSEEYAFRHPMIRTVAYESQLKSDRAGMHRRLAAAVERGMRGLIGENSALIAEHLQAAGDLREAYVWHLRAGEWATTRDKAAACRSWERARRIADALPNDFPDRISMRIAPRTLLCANGFRAHLEIEPYFQELRELCSAAGDKASLAIGMAGLIMEHFVYGRVHTASRLASEHMTMIESIGDPTLTIGLSLGAIATKIQSAEMRLVLAWSQNVVELAQGDPARGNAIVGSPLAVALATRGTARWALGDTGWRKDLEDSVATARGTEPWSHAMVVTYKYLGAIPNGILLADDLALQEIGAALRNAERSSDDRALGLAKVTEGIALVHRESMQERQRGLDVLRDVCEMCEHDQYYPSDRPVANVWAAWELARRGDRESALSRLRAAVDEMFGAGQFGHCGAATSALVQTLLAGGTDGAIAEAVEAIDRMAAAPGDQGLVSREIQLVRMRALLAHARGDASEYIKLRDRYRDMATALGFQGHIAWAAALP